MNIFLVFISVIFEKGHKRVLEWLLRMFNGCFREGKVPNNWKIACIVPPYKGKKVVLSGLTIWE